MLVQMRTQMRRDWHELSDVQSPKIPFLEGWAISPLASFQLDRIYYWLPAPQFSPRSKERVQGGLGHVQKSHSPRRAGQSRAGPNDKVLMAQNNPGSQHSPLCSQGRWISRNCKSLCACLPACVHACLPMCMPALSVPDHSLLACVLTCCVPACQHA